MKLISSTIKSTSALSCRIRFPWTLRSIFTDNSPGDGVNNNKGDNSFESADDFERRIFGGALDADSKNGSFFDKLDRLGKVRGRSGVGSREIGAASGQFNEGIGESFDTLSDDMDAKLKKAATTFVFTNEIKHDDCSFRPDAKFQPGMVHTLRDLDLTKPEAQKPFRRPQFETTTQEVLKKADFRDLDLAKSEAQKPFRRTQFETTTQEVLKKADFRNVRFLSNFLTEAGLIIKRSKTRISAKAQRKVAREIKIARAFGLLPFTTMGTKQFQFGKSMEDLDEDMEFENFYSQPVTAYFEDKRNA